MTRAFRTASSHRAAMVTLTMLGAVLLGGGACSYDPHPEDGKVGCSADGKCPQGYTCQYPAAACYSDTTVGAGVSLDTSDYVGVWAFGPAANVVTSCNDGSPDSTASLSDPATAFDMSITTDASGLAALESVWLCDLLLDVDSTGAHLGPGNHVCTANRLPTDPSTAPQSQTWTTTRFDFSITKRDRNAATHVAEYNRMDVYSAVRVVTCHQIVRGGLLKQ